MSTREANLSVRFGAQPQGTNPIERMQELRRIRLGDEWSLADGAQGFLIDGCSGACAGTGIKPQAKRRKIRKEMDNLAVPRYWILPAIHP